jgi:hypothetical protein
MKTCLTILLAMLVLSVGAYTNEWMGLGGGLSPLDTVETHNLAKTTHPKYVQWDISYQYYLTNGSGFLFADRCYGTNAPFVQFVGFGWPDDLPTNQIASFFPVVTDRYPNVYAWVICNEFQGPTYRQHICDMIRMFHDANPNVRICAPAESFNYDPYYCDYILAEGAFTNLDIFVMHDYVQCPGNGGPISGEWWTNDYDHPYQMTVHPTYPTMTERLDWMNTYTNALRTNFPGGPKVAITEYGLYASNTADAYAARRIAIQYGVPFFVQYPTPPANVYGVSAPYHHGVTNPLGGGYTFTESLQAFSKLLGARAQTFRIRK